MITLEEFVAKYSLDSTIPQNIFDEFYLNSQAETSRYNFGESLWFATELLTAHYCELWMKGSSSPQQQESGIPINWQEFRLDHEGYTVKLQGDQSAKNPYGATRWGVEYWRLLRQVIGNESGVSASEGATVVRRRGKEWDGLFWG
jgi:hypothetical protein